MINGKSVIVGLADDDRVFQFITGKILRSLNLIDKFLQFKNGQELLDYLLENANKPENLPGIIFLDIQMPFMDGWQFLNEYSKPEIKFSKQIDIYILSSSISLYDQAKSRSFYHIKDYLVKPVAKEVYKTILTETYNKS
jgi:CheY-like chemotaxis protein